MSPLVGRDLKSLRGISSALMFILAVVVCAGCRKGLSANFNDLSLDDKIKVYGQYLDEHINPQESARHRIASYGGPAAARMGKILEGKRSGFPTYEAITIIQEIQETRCTLRSSFIPHALEKFLKRNDSQPDFTHGKVVLDEIEGATDLSPCRLEDGVPVNEFVDPRAAAIWKKQEAVFMMALGGHQENDDFLEACGFFEGITGVVLHLNYFTFGALPTRESNQDLKLIKSWYKSNGHCLHWDESSKKVKIRSLCVVRRSE